MLIDHPKLVRLLQKAYSAEKAAAFAYIGHAGSVRDPKIKAGIKQIEDDEWGHRTEVLKIMNQYDIPIARFSEVKFHIIGRIISASCYVIGQFMPYFFAGRLESGNVCEYFVMMHYFNELGITKHDETLYEMGIKEKEHEVFFYEMIKDAKWLPYFEKIFNWGVNSFNDVNLDEKLPIHKSNEYCRKEK
jgi:rubrerythrin